MIKVYGFYWGHANSLVVRASNSKEILSIPVPDSGKLMVVEKAVEQALNRLEAKGEEIVSVYFSEHDDSATVTTRNRRDV